MIDYELRRELLRASKSKGLAKLDALASAATYLPISTSAMRRAAEFWALARNLGMPTAVAASLDVDVILAAQAATCGYVDYVVATTHVRHLSLFVPAEEWHKIRPDTDQVFADASHPSLCRRNPPRPLRVRPAHIAYNTNIATTPPHLENELILAAGEVRYWRNVMAVPPVATSLPKRPQSRGEEIANCASHGLAVCAALVAVPVLVLASLERGDAAAVIGASVFAGALVLLYGISTVYHALPQTPAKCLFRLLDHIAIYLLIAGTYTPFTLGVLRGGWGWTLFALVWGLALFGILLKSLAGVRFEVLSVLLYLVMGWLCLIAVEPMLALVPAGGLAWLLAGGIAYTVGVVFYALDDRVRYCHFVWHLFVVAGSGCHFIAVLQYAA